MAEKFFRAGLLSSKDYDAVMQHPLALQPFGADSDESGHLFQSISDSIPGLGGQLSERSDARDFS